MKSLLAKEIFCAAALLLFFPGRLRSQGLDPAIIANPPVDSWPSYHGDYSGRRHSRLTQIAPQNVASLALAWTFQTNQKALIKSSPLLVDGVLYFSVPDNVWAVDARSGHQIWRYTYKQNPGMHLGNRGVAMYKQWLYFSTPDAHLISLDAKNGKLRWDVEVGDVNKGYWTTMAPLVVRDHVILGVGGDLDNIGAYIRSFDPETGNQQWHLLSTYPHHTLHISSSWVGTAMTMQMLRLTMTTKAPPSTRLTLVMSSFLVLLPMRPPRHMRTT
jgi:alcohol dehydrogenase (cytochrome c)